MSDSQHPLQKPAQSARQWAMLCHLSAFLGVMFPFGNLLGPLILWQMKKDSDPFIDAQGREALNFQITVAIAATVSILLMLVVIGFALFMLVGLGALVLTIIAGVKANEGVDYRYPFTWRLLK
ncbi:DUF4870 domain-containing protein [Pseudomonas alliivorans]|uniref:DUF4870 domain-containing protein n=1 Tax=Pseudomonas alliivorans TaxID=2810613 RepID=A0ABS4C5G6_9PSED|nr:MULTISPECIES: DUF4870 domain-containing protein [Pseudomonas]MBP0940053.1 DUF4870 domain-containing protein [Pseudomonas alliivorans]MBP0945630.1 DUF4870 domain-containing protein [Pseudomonas alliivorans]MBP0950880.1 DUF4870 domain-containing protein [Pseudomonas alliivorans]MCO5367765.1 DUF4870 domain-containing protein [Pseudomonas alliivorans]MEE4326152.1 DUF4870 domain-containing protein [Pseudomonas alliivorans]